MQRLIKVQSELKAPKNQRNNFGGYNFRSCEDILEAVKPLLNNAGLLLKLSDEIVEIGGRFYVKATATVCGSQPAFVETATAYAREANEKKGMDASQVTGTASSYARKYALNGLFLIDDTKDADTPEHHNQQQSAKQSKTAPQKAAQSVAEAKTARNAFAEWLRGNEHRRKEVHEWLRHEFGKGEKLTYELTEETAAAALEHFNK